MDIMQKCIVTNCWKQNFFNNILVSRNSRSNRASAQTRREPNHVAPLKDVSRPGDGAEGLFRHKPVTTIFVTTV